MFGALGLAIASTCLTFVSQAALSAGVPEKRGLKRRAVAVKNTRAITKRGIVHNDYLPVIAPRQNSCRLDWKTTDGGDRTVCC